ncbi:MAG: pyridoxal phosphate-dependent aminotransferase [Burkholderiales bacterium]|nr:pyridoxal phosphate-dependent aminotransferase [Burkholderiales bacterium]
MSISAIKEMAMLGAKIKDVASLAWGLPSFRTPQYIRDSVSTALASDPDIGKYALPDGLKELRKLVALKHARETGMSVDADSQVMITAGNMQGLNTLFHVCLDPGDEVIVTDPGFASHFQQIRLCGGKPVHWRLQEENGWALDVENLPKLITVRTKAIVLVTPSNPTGKIFSKKELLQVGAIAKANDLLLLLDDPYLYLTYENKDKHFNLASQMDLLDNTVYCFTFSKCYAMSGWRLGYMILPPQLKKEALKVHDATLICTPRISQVAGIAALKGETAHLKAFEEILSSRRDLITQRLDRIPHIFEYIKPEGAYYIFPRILAEHENSREFAIRLLNEAHVSVTPGSAFGPSGEHHVRMAFCVEDAVINTAFDRIEAYFGHVT